MSPVYRLRVQPPWRGGVDVSHARAVTRRIPPILRADAYQHDVRLSGYPNRYTVMKSALVCRRYRPASGTSSFTMRTDVAASDPPSDSARSPRRRPIRGARG